MYARKEYAPAPGRAWGEGEIRRLLRGLQRPHILEAEPLAQALCAAYRLEKPYDAVLRLIRQTFVNRGLVGKRLFGLIQQCDIDGTATQLAIAGKMNISTRQFFRYRREAVRALALQANTDLQQTPRGGGSLSELARLLSDVDPASAATVYRLLPQSGHGNVGRIETLIDAGQAINDDALKGCNGAERLFSLLAIARALFVRGDPDCGMQVLDAVRTSIFDSAFENRDIVEFEILVAQYVHALYYLDAGTAAQVAHNLRSAAKNDEKLMRRALLVEIEASIRSGAVSRAVESFAVCEPVILRGQRIRDIGELAWCEAAIAFMRGDLETAEASLQGAMLALRLRPHESMKIEALRGRVKLQMGMPWAAPPHLLAHQETSEIAVTPSSATGLLRSRQHPLMYAHLQLRAVHLRAMILGERSAGEASLEQFRTDAAKAGYPVHSACASALMANFYERRAQPARAQAAYLSAWKIYAQTQDELLGRDLIIFDSAKARDFGPVSLNDAFLRAFHQVMQRRFPNAALEQIEDERLRHMFWRVVIPASYARTGETPGRDLLDRLLAAAAHAAPQTERQKHRDAYIAEAAQRLSVLIPVQTRAGFIDRFTVALRGFHDTLDSVRGRVTKMSH